MALIDNLKQAQTMAMKARDKQRLGTIRLVMSEIKQREVDERVTLNDDDVLAVLTKMLKQRRDSFAQYQEAGRHDLADIEQAEMNVLADFMPQPFSEQEIDALLEEAVQQTQASGPQDIGKIMTWLKPQVQGRADMAELSKKVRLLLSA